MSAGVIAAHYVASTPPTGPALVQPTVTNAVNATSMTLTLGSGTTAGSALVLLWVGQSTRSVTAVSGCGATWSRAIRQPSSSGAQSVEIWVGLGATASGTTVTVTHNAGAALFRAYLMEWSGLATSSVVGSTIGSGPATTATVTAGALTPTKATDLVVTVVGKITSNTTTFDSVSDTPTAWTDLGIVGSNEANAGYLIAPSTASAQRTWTLSAAASVTVAAAVIKAA